MNPSSWIAIWSRPPQGHSRFCLLQCLMPNQMTNFVYSDFKELDIRVYFGRLLCGHLCLYWAAWSKNKEGLWKHKMNYVINFRARTRNTELVHGKLKSQDDQVNAWACTSLRLMLPEGLELIASWSENVFQPTGEKVQWPCSLQSGAVLPRDISSKRMNDFSTVAMTH